MLCVEVLVVNLAMYSLGKQKHDKMNEENMFHQNLAIVLVRPLRLNSHVAIQARKLDEWSRDKGQDHAQNHLACIKCLVQASSANRSRDDEARDNTDRTGNEPSEPGPNTPFQHPLAHHLAGHSADDPSRDT